MDPPKAVKHLLVHLNLDRILILLIVYHIPMFFASIFYSFYYKKDFLKKREKIEGHNHKDFSIDTVVTSVYNIPTLLKTGGKNNGWKSV